MRRSLLVVCLPLALLLLACGGSLQDQEKEARAALDARDWAGARSVAEKALAESGAASDPAIGWRLELIRLEALASAKEGSEVVSSLERLASAYPQQVTPALYRALAGRLEAADEKSGAIDVLVAGDQRFPAEHEAFAEAIESLGQRGIDPAEVERLKALGYL